MVETCFKNCFAIVDVRDRQSGFITRKICLNDEEIADAGCDPDEEIMSTTYYPKHGNGHILKQELLERDK